MEGSELTQHLLLALAIIVVTAQVVGWLAQRVGQPRVLGEIVAGIVLGPSLLGAISPGAADALFPAALTPYLQPIAHLGLVLFMFLVGMQLDPDHLRGRGHRAVVISHASIIVPFAMGSVLALWLHPRVGGDSELLPFSLFVGAAMAVTAFPVLARILQETGLDRLPVGTMALACAAVDDITAWCILAAVLAIAGGTGAAGVIVTIAGTTAFTLAMAFLVRPLLRRWGDVPLAVAIGLALGAAWLTEAMGIHAIFGAFLAGVVMPRHTGDRLVLMDRLDAITGTVLLPVFFMVVGLSTDIGALESSGLWGAALVVFLVASAGKFGAAGLAARVVGESWRDAVTIGVLMNTRGLTEIVILTVGLERGIIGPTMFTIMVMMALATTVLAVPIIARTAPDSVRSGARVAGSA